MDIELISILKYLGNECGSKFFVNRILFRNKFLEFYNKDNHEHRLLLRIANSGYLTLIAKSFSILEKRELLINKLYEDESIVKEKAELLVNSLSKIIDEINKNELKQIEYNKKTAEEKAKQEFLKEKQLLENVILNSLLKIIKYKGIKELDNYNYCRAYLKDMAKGDFIEQITHISIMLKNNIHQIILKKRLFKMNKNNLIEKIKKGYNNIVNDSNVILVSLLIDVINESSRLNNSEKGGNYWINKLFKSSSK